MVNVKKLSSRWNALFFLLVSGCGVSPVPQVAEPELRFKVTDAPLSNETKIFLIAGGQETASFAQEVIDQRRLWLERGYRAEEIACYYSVPTTQNYHADQRQYNQLNSELKNCYGADLNLIEKHFLDVARAKDNNSPKYFYFSSHGTDPQSVEAQKSNNAQTRQSLLEMIRLKPWTDQFFLDVQMDRPNWRLVTLSTRFRSRDPKFGASPQGTYALSPATLRRLLIEFDSEKVVALQGCYSGGFLGSPSKTAPGDTLASLAKITVLTASAHDRTSFGCDTGAERTVYGDALLEELRLSSGPLENIDWRKVSRGIIERVNRKERGLKVKASNPQFFSNAI